MKLRNRTLASLVFAIVLGGLIVLLFQGAIREAVYAKMTVDMFVGSDPDEFEPGPVVGSRFPGLDATWRGERVTQLQRFAGPLGTVLVASRSVDWCPYCRRQMIQLQEHAAQFRDAGIGLVAITYDGPALQREFAEQFDISFPLLSDNEARTFKTLGILNRDFGPDDPHYGIPHPGMIVVDDQGTVVETVFIKDYTTRIDSQAAFELARDALSPARRAPAGS